MATPDWNRIREDFPVLNQRVHGHPLIYFDNAATSQKPSAVIEALRRFYEHDNANVHRGLHELSARATAQYEGARQRVAEYIGAASAEEIVFTRGTTESINLIAQSWGGKFLKTGDVILLTEMEHHSNLVPWQLLAERTGAKLRYVPVLDDGTLALDQLPTLLTGEVKLFAFVHISNALGTINPVAALCAKARAVGALTLVDLAQSAGHMPLNVQEIGCDFAAFSSHKMYGPTGMGALYGRREILEQIPPWHGGGEMITSVTLEKSTFKAPPHRFEAGTPNIAGAIGLAAAIDYIESIGREKIWEHDAQLTAHALESLGQIPGVRILGPTGERGAIVSFVLKSAHPHDVTTFADQKGLALRGGHHCAQPLMRRLGLPGTTRASFAFYNTRDEIDRMADIVRDAVHFFFMSNELEELYQEVILDHARKPRNFGELSEASVRVHGDNPSCGDEIHLAVKYGPEGGLERLMFTGHGCAISQASASMMTMKLKGKSREETAAILGQFRELIMDGKEGELKSLGDLRLLAGVRSFPQRVKCAMLAWRALEQALQQSDGEATISTEVDE